MLPGSPCLLTGRPVAPRRGAEPTAGLLAADIAKVPLITAR
jgi:hypothetical protein